MPPLAAGELNIVGQFLFGRGKHGGMKHVSIAEGAIIYFQLKAGSSLLIKFA